MKQPSTKQGSEWEGLVKKTKAFDILVKKYIKQERSTLLKQVRKLDKRTHKVFENIGEPRQYIVEWVKLSDVEKLIEGSGK